MEENKDDIIYDLDSQETQAEAVMGSGQSDRWPEGAVTGTVSEQAPETTAALAPEGAQTDCASGAAVRITAPHDSDVSEPSDPAKAEIERMVDEMGAETLLEIIRDNRNAAIRQIISEVEASRDRTIPSGASASMGCTSIFDLAALA